MALRVSQINGCALCIDMHTKEATAVDETPVDCTGRGPARGHGPWLARIDVTFEPCERAVRRETK